ncbi:CpaE family protein [Siccirubricoccus deserti]
MALGAGRLVTVTGACGGVGATTTAANFAWFLGTVLRRHTVLLDPDLETGSLAFVLNVQPGTGLQAALSAPDRIDELFIERSVVPVTGRLHILANDEMPDRPIRADEAASARLIEALRKKYTFVVADVPFRPDPLFRGLLHLADQRVIVMEPTLASVRRALRLLALPKASDQAQHPVVVLNQLGMPGGLKRRQLEDALGIRADIVIPYLPRPLMDAANLGEPAAAKRGAFRDAVVQLTQQLPFVRFTPESPLLFGRKHWWQRLWRK